MVYSPDKIRNIAVVGHQGSGKTTLVEALSYIGGLIDRKGSIETKNTISDFLDDEKKRQTSLSSSIIPMVYHDYKFNFIDVPGNDDFVYELLGVTRLIKGAVLVIDATKGVQIGTIKDFKLLRKRGVPIFIYVNRKISTSPPCRMRFRKSYPRTVFLSLIRSVRRIPSMVSSTFLR